MNKKLIDFSDYIRYQCNWTKLRRGICGKIHVCYIDKTTYLCMFERWVHMNPPFPIKRVHR